MEILHVNARGYPYIRIFVLCVITGCVGTPRLSLGVRSDV